MIENSNLAASAPNPDIRTTRVKFFRMHIVKAEPLTHDTLALVLSHKADNGILHAQAGQFCTIKVPDLERARAYSLARAPAAERPGEHTFFVRLIADGEFSQWLSAENREGYEVEVSGPLGQFTLDTSDSAMVCIAGGSGMSAIYSIIEQAQLSQAPRDCYFYYGARSQADLFMLDEIKKIQQHWHPSFKFEFTPVLSDEPVPSNWRGETGLVGETAAVTLGNASGFDWGNSHYYLCGPPKMVDSSVQKFILAGAPEENCRFDRFESAYGPAPMIDNHRCVLCDECLLVKPTQNCIVESTNLSASDLTKTRVKPLLTSGLYYNSLVIDEEHCIRCHACVEACPHGAISVPGLSDKHPGRNDSVNNGSLRQPASKI